MPKKERDCMYTAQGDLLCGLPPNNQRRYSGGKGQDPNGFGDIKAVERARGEASWLDPYNVNTSSRDVTGETTFGKEKTQGDKKDAKTRPCCKCDCLKTGPCKNPAAVMRSPAARCVLCQTGQCNHHC